MPKNKIAKSRSIKQIRKSMINSGIGFDSDHILKLADKEVSNTKKLNEFGPETYFYKAITLFEFEKGLLLASSIPERYRIFAIDFSQNLQKEYDCLTPSEKSMTEIIALNFVRTLEIQHRIDSYLNIGSITDMGVKYLGVLSKELDRAQRHYLASLDALKTFKTPPLGVSIKTQTAIVGQKQIVQANNRQNVPNDS
ncbi:hypothetical protein ACFL0Y_03525 [Patescibacteria group bacterium]